MLDSRVFHKFFYDANISLNTDSTLSALGNMIASIAAFRGTAGTSALPIVLIGASKY
jgi:hypothetical protein